VAKGLKQSIVVVNEFSVPGVGRRTRDGRSGSRGSSPKDYILRYTAGHGTEPIPPVRQVDVESFVRRYMARASAVEALRDDEYPALRREMEKVAGQGGVAFGYGSYSLSDEALRSAAADVQRQFDAGHPVMKTVLSFDADWLRQHGLVPEGFAPQAAGDFRGNLDQLRLRLAIMRGLDRVGRSCFADLRYVGVVQVDTMHVHCHLAMVDAGDATNRRGMLDERAKSLLRRGTDSYLDETSRVAHLSSAVRYEQRNTTAYVKRWAFRKLREGSLTQSLVAVLPADRRQWRYGTNRKEMARANRLAVELVEAALLHPDSGYPEAMASVRRYADSRRRREGLTRPQWRKLVDDGRERIVERGVNAVYAVLRQTPEETLRQVSTAMLDASAAEPVPDWGTEGAAGFVARLRIAGRRLAKHSRAARAQRLAARDWEERAAAGAASEDSAAMKRHYDVEREYHEACAAKYTSILPVVSVVDDALRTRLEEASALSDRLAVLEALRADASLRRLHDPAEAERLGQYVYGEEGGWLACEGSPASLAELGRRAAARRAALREALEGLRDDLADRGMDLLEEGGRPTAVPRPRRPELMAVDLQDCDELAGRDLPEPARRGLAAWTRTRRAALDAATGYLRASGQPEAVRDLAAAAADVAAMERALAGDAPVTAPAAPLPAQERVRTVPAGARRPHEDLVAAVRRATLEAAAEAVGTDPDEVGTDRKPRDGGLG